MRSYLAFVSACAILASGAAGATEFRFLGNSEISEQVLVGVARAVVCSQLDSICLGSICQAVAGHYWDAGYLDARAACSLMSSQPETVLVTIDEGLPSRLRFVKVTGSQAYDAATLETWFAPEVGVPFSRRGLERRIDQLLSFYDSQGYPLASVQPDVISAGEGWIGVGLRVDEGPQARLGQVEFRGLEGTRPDVLLRESGLVSGRLYDGSRVQKVRVRLMRLGVFQSVSEPILSFDSRDTTMLVAFDLVEARANFLEGLVAYAPKGTRSGWVGSLQLRLGNIGGTLRQLTVLWDKPWTDRLSWSIYYREPRLWGKPVAAEGRLSSDVVEKSFAHRRVWAGAALRGQSAVELGLGGFLGTTKDRTESGGEGDFTERGFSCDLRYEGRDDTVNPRNGGLLTVAGRVASLDFAETSSTDRTLTEVDSEGEFLLPLGRSLVTAWGARFQGAFATKGLVPASHLIRLGGMRGLRGYPEEWFTVKEALVLTWELRRLLGSHSRAYLFVDVATLEGGGYDFTALKSLPFGYGMGFMGGSRSGIFRLEIALGRDDVFSEAKIHFGLVQRF
jgi:outer membrane protein assembly factor BamA